MEILQKTIRNEASEGNAKELSFSLGKDNSFSLGKELSFSKEKKIDNLFDFPFISKMSTLSESIPTTMINKSINIDDIKDYLIIDLTDEIQELFNQKQIRAGDRSYQDRKSGRKKGSKNKPKHVNKTNKESDNTNKESDNTNKESDKTDKESDKTDKELDKTDKESDNMDKLGDVVSYKLSNKKLKIKLSNKITDKNNEMGDQKEKKEKKESKRKLVKKSKLDTDTEIKTESTPVRQYPQPRRGVKEVRCSSRIANGGQCKRQSRPGTDLCNGHHKHCPYGKVEGPLEGKFLIVPRRRGPKTRNTKEYSLEELDTSLYQQTEMIKINGQHYLIDNCGFLYKNDNNCEIVGRRISNEIHWYC
jgi:hypothetical protein